MVESRICRAAVADRSGAVVPMSRFPSVSRRYEAARFEPGSRTVALRQAARHFNQGAVELDPVGLVAQHVSHDRHHAGCRAPLEKSPAGPTQRQHGREHALVVSGHERVPVLVPHLGVESLPNRPAFIDHGCQPGAERRIQLLHVDGITLDHDLPRLSSPAGQYAATLELACLSANIRRAAQQ